MQTNSNPNAIPEQLADEQPHTTATARYDTPSSVAALSSEQRVEAIAGRLKEILCLLGEDPEREGLCKTPMRAAKALAYITSGYKAEPSEIIKSALFTHEGSKMVVIKDIEFYSMCEHHILPFFGRISVGYIPTGKIMGLSKMARVVNAFARRLQVQERFTAEVVNEIFRTLNAKGVIAVSTAQHLCMKMRGVEKQNDSTCTIEYTGVFADEPALREEFFRML